MAEDCLVDRLLVDFCDFSKNFDRFVDSAPRYEPAAGLVQKAAVNVRIINLGDLGQLSAILANFR
jgi:hypothetical protein